MVITEEKIQRYIERVKREMKRRGFSDSDIPVVINKTKFMDTLNRYPEEQLHYSASSAVDEILFVASKK